MCLKCLLTISRKFRPFRGCPLWYILPVPKVKYPWSRNWLGKVVQFSPPFCRKSEMKFLVRTVMNQRASTGCSYHILVVDGRLPVMKELRLMMWRDQCRSSNSKTLCTWGYKQAGCSTHDRIREIHLLVSLDLLHEHGAGRMLEGRSGGHPPQKRNFQLPNTVCSVLS